MTTGARLGHGMDRDETLRLMRDLESDRVERTVSTNNTDKFAEAICAFSNDFPQHRQPGYLFVGVQDDGTPSGLKVTDQLLQNLAAIRSDGNVQPLPTLSVQRLQTPEGDVAVVEVLPSDLPPVRYKGRIWIRVGPRRAIASESEERFLAERRVALAKTWDARPCREATLEDLSLDLFTVGYRLLAVAPEIIEENNRNLAEQLAALRFYDSKLETPTNAAILLFCKDPVKFFPGAFVHVHYAGSSKAEEPIRDRRLAGDLLTVLRGLLQLADDVAEARPIPVEGAGDRTVFDYPPRTLHEIFVNAVIHRNYDGSTSPVVINHFDDRIEISNPGGLYGDLSIDEFPDKTSYRNPVLAEAAKILGFVNRFGRGIAIAQAALARNDSPPVTFTPGSSFFAAKVPRRR